VSGLYRCAKCAKQVAVVGQGRCSLCGQTIPGWRPGEDEGPGAMNMGCGPAIAAIGLIALVGGLYVAMEYGNELVDATSGRRIRSRGGMRTFLFIFPILGLFTTLGGLALAFKKAE
jgi:hypothetical protein